MWADAVGVRHQNLFPGPYDSPESRTAFARLQLELELRPTVVAAPTDTLSVDEVLITSLPHADGHYRGRTASRRTRCGR